MKISFPDETSFRKKLNTSDEIQRNTAQIDAFAQMAIQGIYGVAIEFVL